MDDLDLYTNSDTVLKIELNTVKEPISENWLQDFRCGTFCHGTVRRQKKKTSPN